MNIKIIYDNEAKEGFECGWGFSALINDTILFDTGENAHSLLKNIRAFGVNPGDIRHVVLSHEDWDHAGGLALIKMCKAPSVYLPASCSRILKDDIKSYNPNASIYEVDKETTINPDVFITARLGGRKKEISLAVQTSLGLVLITGCAHPGLDKIMKRVSEVGKIYAVVGGFHGFRKLHLLKNIPVIAPCHCTKKKQEIMDMYPEQTQFIDAGTEMYLGQKR